MKRTIGAIALVALAAILLTLLLVSCGPAPDNFPIGSTADQAAFEKIRPLVDQHCFRCHNGIKQSPLLNSAETFKNARVLSEIESGSMPPDEKLSEIDSNALIGYLKR